MFKSLNIYTLANLLQWKYDRDPIFYNFSLISLWLLTSGCISQFCDKKYYNIKNFFHVMSIPHYQPSNVYIRVVINLLFMSLNEITKNMSPHPYYGEILINFRAQLITLRAQI